MPKKARTNPLVTVRPYKHERYGYRLTWKEGTKPCSAYARTKADAEEKARDITRRLIVEGASNDPLSEGERQGVYRWRELAHKHGIPAEVTLAAVVEDYANRWAKHHASATLQTVVNAYMAHREAERKSQRHLDDLRGRLAVLLAHLGADTKVSQVEPGDITAWLGSLPVGQQSKLNYRRVAHAVFSYAVQQQHCERNPAAYAIKPNVPRRVPGILTPAQLSVALHAMLEHRRFDLLPCVVLGAFAGMRTSERMALRWENVHLTDPEPFAQVAEGKTGRRNVPLCPAAVAWLSLCRRQNGPVTPCGENAFQKRLQSFRNDHGLTDWPHNCLRHSCASYRVAQTNQPALVAGELSQSVAVLKKHYHRLVTPAEAKEWFAIMPAEAPANVVAITSGG